MKANEAPEKLYIPFEDEIDRDCLNTYAQKNTYHKEIEYTRTDAFIEKAKEFLSNESNIPLWEDRGGNFGCDMPKLVEKFINYMKGE